MNREAPITPLRSEIDTGFWLRPLYFCIILCLAVGCAFATTQMEYGDGIVTSISTVICGILWTLAIVLAIRTTCTYDDRPEKIEPTTNGNAAGVRRRLHVDL